MTGYPKTLADWKRLGQQPGHEADWVHDPRFTDVHPDSADYFLRGYVVEVARQGLPPHLDADPEDPAMVY